MLRPHSKHFRQKVWGKQRKTVCAVPICTKLQCNYLFTLTNTLLKLTSFKSFTFRPSIINESELRNCMETGGLMTVLTGILDVCHEIITSL